MLDFFKFFLQIALPDKNSVLNSFNNIMDYFCVIFTAYSEPFLYVTYFNSIQAVTIPADKTETRYESLQTHVQPFLVSLLSRKTLTFFVIEEGLDISQP